MGPYQGNTCIYFFLKITLPKMLCRTVRFGAVNSTCPAKDVVFLKIYYIRTYVRTYIHTYIHTHTHTCICSSVDILKFVEANNWLALCFGEQICNKEFL
jgi:hypothetical protein